ncbi:hypothetical protein NF717_12450, partial [Lactococcus formosensis]
FSFVPLRRSEISVLSGFGASAALLFFWIFGFVGVRLNHVIVFFFFVDSVFSYSLCISSSLWFSLI